MARRWVLAVVLAVATLLFCAVDLSAQGTKIIIDTFPDLWIGYMTEALQKAGLADKVDFRSVPQNQYENKLKLMIAGGDVGDVICMDAPNIAYYASSGALEPLDAYWDKADFNDLVGSAQQAMTWNRKIWAAPLNESNCVLYYNRDMFKAAGLTAPTKVADAWTMDQLLAAAVKLTKKDAAGNVKVYGIMPQMFSVDNRNEGMTYTQMLWTWWFGANILSPDGTTTKGYFDSPASLKALHFYQDLFQKYKAAPAMPMTSGFESERVAMWINGPWMVGEWKKNFPEFYKSKWGAMPLPRGAAAASNSGSWNLALTAQSKNKKLAWQVIQAITGTDGALIYCGKSGNIPARKSVLQKTDMSQSPYDIIKDQLVLTARARPTTPNYPAVSEAVMDTFNAVAFGADVEKTDAEAVAKIERALR
ncbi:MAG TPA: extracellular solute-binding protein [Spirochaetia bacterium]|nr:extracellular solute-binding protein [Spirochaetia bacterium]